MVSLLTFDIQSCDLGLKSWEPRRETFPGELNLVADCIKCPVLADHCRFD
jgi:hypothetical protein